jgi:ribosomal protein L16/L10AE
VYRNLRTRDEAIHNMESRVRTKAKLALKLRARELQLSSRKRNRLKGKRLSSPRQIVLKSIENMKGMNIISHRLRPVPIKRCTVPPYYSR